MGKVLRFPVQKAVCGPRITINNAPMLKPGFIFIPVSREEASLISPIYLVERFGSRGYYGKLLPEAPYGFITIPVLNYHG